MAVKITQDQLRELHWKYPVDSFYTDNDIEFSRANIEGIIRDLRLNPRLVNINMDISEISDEKLVEIKSELYHFAALAKESNIRLEFNNKNPLKFLSPTRCCTWFSGHKISPKADILQLATAIESNQKTAQPTIRFNILY